MRAWGYRHAGFGSKVFAESFRLLETELQVRGFWFLIFCRVIQIFADRVAGVWVSVPELFRVLQTGLDACGPWGDNIKKETATDSADRRSALDSESISDRNIQQLAGSHSQTDSQHSTWRSARR